MVQRLLNCSMSDPADIRTKQSHLRICSIGAFGMSSMASTLIANGQIVSSCEWMHSMEYYAENRV